MVSGLIGVPLGSFLAQHFRQTHQRTDPIICAWGLLISAPLVYLALLLARFTEGWCYFIICLAEISLNLCWSIVADILLVSKAIRLERGKTLRTRIREQKRKIDLLNLAYKSMRQIDNNIMIYGNSQDQNILCSTVVIPTFD